MLELLEVAAGAERLVAGAADHEHTRALDPDGVERLVELGHRPQRERVASAGPVDDDRRHAAVDLETEVPHRC